VKKRFMVSAAAALSLAAMLATAVAQQYPSRNVTIIVPYPAGGPTDETARMVAQSLSAQLKQSFVVEDIGGGGSIIGSEKVARAAPDGYTLLVHNLQIAANVSLYENLPFDTVKAFAPVMLINRNPLVLVGRKTLEPSTLGDLVVLMKRQTLKAAIPGYGTTGHLATTLFAQEAGVSLDQIPYRGAAPAVTDLFRRANRSVFCHATIGRAASRHRRIKGLRRYVERKAAGVSNGRQFSDYVRTKARCSVLASHVRAGWNARLGHSYAQ